jgi:hypothetical protein
VSQSDSTDPRQTIGKEAVEPGFGAGARDLVFRKRRHVLQADGLVNGATLLAHELEVVGAAERPAFTRGLAVGGAQWIVVVQ